jgi:hypothetical protein
MYTHNFIVALTLKHVIFDVFKFIYHGLVEYEFFNPQKNFQKVKKNAKFKI